MAALRRARNTPCTHKVRKGVRGKPYQGVCPCSAEPKQTRDVRAGMEPRPYKIKTAHTCIKGAYT